MNFEDFISGTDENPRPRKVVIYGTKGIGKTRWAAACPYGPVVFLPTEDGYQDIRPVQKKWTVNQKRLIDSEAELHQGISWLLSNDHGFGCVILDSAEAAELLIQKQVAATANKDSIADIGFKKGYDSAATKFKTLLDGFDALSQKGIFVIIIAHSEVEKFSDPMTEQYDRFTIRLDKRISPLLQEWADEVFFANYKVYTKTTEESFGKKTNKAIGSGERLVYTTERPTHDAKNRLGMNDEINFNSAWDLYSAAITGGEAVTV